MRLSPPPPPFFFLKMRKSKSNNDSNNKKKLSQGHLEKSQHTLSVADMKTWWSIIVILVVVGVLQRRTGNA